MKAYRVAVARHANTVDEMLSSDGAREFGGRWNSPGVRAVYCAESLSLAALEVLVHIPRSQTLARYRFLEVDMPSKRVIRVDNEVTTDEDTVHWGDSLLGADGVLAFSVVSVVMPYERNVVLNPEHRDFQRAIKQGEIRPFPFDERLLLR